MEKLFLYLTTNNLSAGISYWIIFGILVACGLGFPLPEDVPLIATGYLIWEGTMQWLPGITITMFGVLIGDTLLFFLGRKMGMRILEQERVQTLFKPEKIRRVRAYFRKYGEKLVFFARFVAGFRAVAFFMAGAMGMRYSRFLFLDGLAALLSVPVWIGVGWALGHYLGDEISQILKSMKEVKLVVTGIIVVACSVIAIRGYLKYRRAKRLQQATTTSR